MPSWYTWDFSLWVYILHFHLVSLSVSQSAQIRLNREDFEAFVVHPDTKEPMDVDSFCANVVQAMGKEAGEIASSTSIAMQVLIYDSVEDNVEMEALCRALQLNVDVAYLSGVRGDGVDFITFRHDTDSKAPPLTLLYRYVASFLYEILSKC